MEKIHVFSFRLKNALWDSDTLEYSVPLSVTNDIQKGYSIKDYRQLIHRNTLIITIILCKG